MKRHAGKAESKTALWFIGVWATVWWGLSFGYFLVLVWESRTLYVNLANSSNSTHFFEHWAQAIKAVYSTSFWWPTTLAIIVVVWLLGSWFWLRELKRQHISYADGFKDLLLTIRK
jgi:hypothetical protein